MIAFRRLRFLVIIARFTSELITLETLSCANRRINRHPDCNKSGRELNMVGPAEYLDLRQQNFNDIISSVACRNL
jgi:hypothetical protein